MQTFNPTVRLCYALGRQQDGLAAAAEGLNTKCNAYMLLRFHAVDSCKVATSGLAVVDDFRMRKQREAAAVPVPRSPSSRARASRRKWQVVVVVLSRCGGQQWRGGRSR